LLKKQLKKKNDFLPVLTIALTRFSLIPVMGDIAVDMYQGHRICVRVFCLLYSLKLVGKKKKKRAAHNVRSFKFASTPKR
jgi:hypothetical protein